VTDSRRYRIQFELQPDDRTATYSTVTSRGELMAAVMAALRHAADKPEDRITGVEIVSIEDDFTIDPQRDLLSYWEVA
jgi:hypothetical protein